jgi:hypothetical protein
MLFGNPLGKKITDIATGHGIWFHSKLSRTFLIYNKNVSLCI